MPQIRLLGELEVVRDGRPVPLPASKKTRALLGYLAVEPRGTLRERLCELLWEGPDDPRAQLRWSLSKLRPLLAGVELRADRERVELCAGEGDVDLRAVEGAVGREIGSAPLDSLRAAAARFRGELLDGLDLPGCYRYQAWLEGRREAARALRVEILQALCERLSGEPEQALEHARAWVAAEPLAESAHAQVVRHLGALGRRQEAMRQIDACRELLARELGAEPSGPLERARHELNARPRATAVEVAAPSRARPVEASAPGGGAQLPFVGRAAELRTIEALIAAAAAGRLGELLLVTGDAGVGKTRLFAELTARVAAAGGRVLAGRAFEAEMVRPYGAWIDALRALPAAAVDAGLRADLAPLRPDLGAAHADADRGRLFTAVARLLAKEAERAPLVVVLDDLHWIDESSAALLSSVARAELGGRVILAAGARAGELSDNAAALKLIRALGRDRRLRTVELGPLEREDITALTRGVDAGVDSSRVFAESAGNPLFALELARAGRDGDASLGLDALIAERLERLEPRARELLPFAAALGRSFSPELLDRASGVPAAELLAAVETLERGGILRSSDDGARYDFVHDLVRNAAYRRLSLPRRRLVHGQIARAMEPLADEDGALASDLAHHAALAGAAELAARACVAAGARALRLFAEEEADELALRGLRQCEALPAAARLPLQMKLYALRVHARREGDARALEAAISRATVESQSAGLTAAVQLGFELLSYLYFRVEDFRRAEDSTLRSVEAARAADPTTAARVIATTSRCLVLIERDVRRAEALAGEARAIEDAHHLALPEVRWALGLVRHHLGDYDGAAVELALSVERYADTVDHWSQAMCLLELAEIALERRRPADLLRWCAEVERVTSKMSEGSERPFGAALRALASVLERRPDWPEIERTLAELRAVDAKSVLAYALNTAAELELEAGDVEAARRRAVEALAAATAVDRRTEQVLAHMLLARTDLAAGDRDAARGRLETVLPCIADRYTVASRARRAAAGIAEALGLALPLTE